MPTSPEEGLEKSATLLIALGEEQAAEVLRQLGPREVQKLGHAMATLKSVPRVKVEAVLDEFHQIATEHGAVHVDTDNYIRSVLTKALGDDKAS
ncbi:MAG TPA: flagellar motor switch protein FliG, partial [Azonexus sp.]